MLTLRPLAPFLQRTFFAHRFYVRPTTKGSATTTDNMKQVHQETLRYISPTCMIKVTSDTFIKVRAADVHEYPGGDVFIAQLHGGPAKNCTASMEIQVSDDERNVEVVVKKLIDSATDFHCELYVPVKASLDICAKGGTTVANIYGESLKLKAQNYVAVSDVKAETIDIESVDGNIIGHGLLLGKMTKLETKNKGHIILDKLQGDEIICKTNTGNITTSCCYVESSTFETNCGKLDLQNVHKTTQVRVNHDGDLKMTGVHGNIKVNFNGKSMDLQLSELVGENYIKADRSQSLVDIKISEEIESGTSIVAKVGNDDSIIVLDTSLQHLSAGLHEKKQSFSWPLDKEHPHKLQIAVKNSLTLGKSSWSDMLRLSMSQNQNNNNNK